MHTRKDDEMKDFTPLQQARMYQGVLVMLIKVMIKSCKKYGVIFDHVVREAEHELKKEGWYDK